MQEFVKIGLISYTKTDLKDEYGDYVLTETTRNVFARVKSISQNEFYQAQTAGMKPAYKFVLTTSRDYLGEQRLIYAGNVYEVQRTYITPADEIEITVYGGVRNNERTENSYQSS